MLCRYLLSDLTVHAPLGILPLSRTLDRTPLHCGVLTIRTRCAVCALCSVLTGVPLVARDALALWLSLCLWGFVPYSSYWSSCCCCRGCCAWIVVGTALRLVRQLRELGWTVDEDLVQRLRGISMILRVPCEA